MKYLGWVSIKKCKNFKSWVSWECGEYDGRFHRFLGFEWKESK